MSGPATRSKYTLKSNQLPLRRLRHRVKSLAETIAEIDLMFSHIDNNLSGKQFPQENFVFTDLFGVVLRASGIPAPDMGLRQ